MYQEYLPGKKGMFCSNFIKSLKKPQPVQPIKIPQRHIYIIFHIIQFYVVNKDFEEHIICFEYLHSYAVKWFPGLEFQFMPPDPFLQWEIKVQLYSDPLQDDHPGEKSPFCRRDCVGSVELNNLGTLVSTQENQNTNSDLTAKNPAFSRHESLDRY